MSYQKKTGRTTTSQVLALRRIIEGIKEYNPPAVLTFIDFKAVLMGIPKSDLLGVTVALIHVAAQQFFAV